MIVALAVGACVALLCKVTRPPRARSRRLCGSCFVIGKPIHHQDRWYCSSCGAPRPMHLRSYAAQQFLQRRRQILGGSSELFDE